MAMMFEISAELAQATVRYLASKPYGEVNQLITAFQQLKPMKPAGAPPVPPKAPVEPPKGK